MREQWNNIPDFPRYNVSSRGRIENVDTGRIMRLVVNQRGITYVGLMKDGVQYKRAVALLVASSFLHIPIHQSFDSVIHLDGDRQNCEAVNLMWRPHHFVINYMRQFHDNTPQYLGAFYVPETKETFMTSREMSVKYGVLEKDIVQAIVNGYMVWPTKLTVEASDR